MFLQSIAHALPPASLTQPEVYEVLRQTQPWGSLRQRSRDLVQRVLMGDSGIAQRHFCFSDAGRLFSASPDELNRCYETAAPALAATALNKALARAGLLAGDVDALFLCSCTGYLCPGPSSHTAEIAGLRPDCLLHDMQGLGCGAAIPALRAAAHFLAAEPGATAAVVAVEVCSAAFYLNDDPGVLISLCLFGDGAAATVWRGRGPGRRATGFRSLHLPGHREKIRFINAGGKLCNQLDRSVPGLAAGAVAQLHSAGAAAGSHVISHSGGREVISALREALPGASLAETTRVLRDCGNMSSPSVLFALEHALSGEIPGPLWLTAFGAGFSAHCCQLEADMH
jgi:alkylresorcinol/alkylpyrone synthase